MRHCNGEDPNLVDPENNTGNCGRRFDDVDHWTICPHEPFFKAWWPPAPAGESR